MASLKNRIEKLEQRLASGTAVGLTPQIRAFLDELFAEVGESRPQSWDGLTLRERLDHIYGDPVLRRACIRRHGSTPVEISGRLVFTGIPRRPTDSLLEEDEND